MGNTLHDELAAAYDSAVDEVEEKEVESAQDSDSQESASNDSEPNEPKQSAQAEPGDHEAPSHWSQEDREVFKALDRKGKEFLLRRHKDMETMYTKKQQQLSEESRVAESFRKAVSPYESYLKQLNMDPIQAFDKLIATEKRLRTSSPQEKRQLLNSLAKDYQIDLTQAEQEELDPRTKILFEEIQRTREETNRHKELIGQIFQEKQDAETRAIKAQVEDFAYEKDAEGKLKHPHFEIVRQDMGMLMQSGRAGNLADAYKKAILLNEDLHKDYFANINKAAETTPKKVLNSKNAGFNVKAGSSSSSVSEGKKPDASLEDTIRQAIEAQQRGSKI